MDEERNELVQTKEKKIERGDLRKEGRRNVRKGKEETRIEKKK